MTKIRKNKIMVFGTFDFLHKGHISFFKQAKRLAKNPYLIVSVARDINVLKIKKQKPFFNEKQRLKQVKQTKIPDKALLGNINGFLPHIVRQNPEIIALGYDQKAYVKNLKTLLKKAGRDVKVVRLKPFLPNIYKSSLLKKIKM